MMKDDANYTINITLRLVFNSLSFLGSSFIIISFLKFKKLRKFAFKLICYLSISDMVFSIASFLIVDKAEKGAFCSFQGFALYYSSLSTVFWTSCIAYSLQKVVLSNNRDIEKKEKWLLVIGFIFPLILAVIPLAMGSYGPASFQTDKENHWCGIVRDKDSKGNETSPTGLILDWIVRFIPILLCFFFNALMYLKVMSFFRNLEIKTDLMDIIKKKIKYFPLIPIFCWSMEIVLRILELISYMNGNDVFDHKYIIYIEYFDSVFEKSHGLLNAILYGFTQYVRQEWRNYFKKRMGKTSADESIEDTLNNSEKGWEENEKRFSLDNQKI